MVGRLPLAQLTFPFSSSSNCRGKGSRRAIKLENTIGVNIGGDARAKYSNANLGSDSTLFRVYSSLYEEKISIKS